MEGKRTSGFDVRRGGRRVTRDKEQDGAGGEERSNKSPLFTARLESCPDAKGEGDPGGGPKPQRSCPKSCQRRRGRAPIDAIYPRSRASVALIAKATKVPVSANRSAPNPKKTIEFAGVRQRETCPNHWGIRRSSDKAAVIRLATV